MPKTSQYDKHPCVLCAGEVHKHKKDAWAAVTRTVTWDGFFNREVISYTVRNRAVKKADQVTWPCKSDGTPCEKAWACGVWLRPEWTDPKAERGESREGAVMVRHLKPCCINIVNAS